MARGDLAPRGGGVGVGGGGVAQGQVDGGEAGLDLDQGRDVRLNLLPGAPRGPDMRHVVPLLGGHGLIASGDRGLQDFAQSGFADDGGVHRVHGDPGAAGDVRDRRDRIPVLDEEFAGGVQHRPPGGDGLFGPAWRVVALAPPRLLDIYDEVGIPATERRLPDAGVSDADVARWLELGPRYGLRVVGPPIPEAEA
jgi:hypothetical protein